MTRLWLLLLGILLISGNPGRDDLTNEEISAFAAAIEKSAIDRNPTFLNHAIHKKELINRVIINLKQTNGIKKRLEKTIGIGDIIINNRLPKATFKKILYYKKEQTHHLIFRRYANGGLNYYDFELAKYNEKCCIVDMFVYSTGLNYSESLRILIQQMSANSRDSSSFTISGINHVNAIGQIDRLLLKNDPVSAKKKFEKLPQQLKDSKIYQNLNIQICYQLGTKEYDSAITKYKESFPEDPSLLLKMIDGYFIKKEYSKSIDAVNKLDSVLGKDPILDLYRANIYFAQNNFEKRLKALEQLTNNMPDFEDGILALIIAHISKGNYSKAHPYINRYRSETGFEQKRLSEILSLFPQN